jgi:tripartite-type tricarboxylate transporter receptor subunit TctC
LVLARIVSIPWGRSVGTHIVVDNRAGAAGMIATEIAARAVPDGYTLRVDFPGPLIIGPGMRTSGAIYRTPAQRNDGAEQGDCGHRHAQ